MLRPNRHAVDAFLVSMTQWRTAGMGGLLGLDYGAAKVAAEAAGINWRKAFAGLRVMELAVLSLAAESREGGQQ